MDAHLVRALQVCIVQLILVFWERQAPILACSTMALLAVLPAVPLILMIASTAYAAATGVSNIMMFTGLQVQTLDVLRPKQLVLFVRRRLGSRRRRRANLKIRVIAVSN